MVSSQKIGDSLHYAISNSRQVETPAYKFANERCLSRKCVLHCEHLMFLCHAIVAAADFVFRHHSLKIVYESGVNCCEFKIV